VNYKASDQLNLESSVVTQGFWQRGDRQAEADVGGAGVGALGLPGRRPITVAVVRRSEERPPLDHMLDDAWIPGIARRRFPVDHRIAATSEGLVAHGIPILGPLPDVAGDVEQAVTVGWERPYGGRSAIAILGGVAAWKRALPGVGVVGVPGVAPGEYTILQATPGREFPLGFAW